MNNEMKQIADELRVVAQEATPEVSGRSKVLAIGVALALAVKSSNEAPSDVTDSNEYYLKNCHIKNGTIISAINERLLFDVRSAMRLVRQFYNALQYVRKQPLGIIAEHVGIGAGLLQFDKTIHTEDLEFIQNNQESCIRVYNKVFKLLSEEAVKDA